MEMNYFKKTGKMMVAACMLAGLPFIPGTVSASELQTQMMSVQMESTTLKELFDLIEEKFNYLKSATPFPKCYLQEKWTFDS